MKSLNCVEISAWALRNNFRVCRRTAQAGADILAMVKADAYGHGMIDCARVLVQEGAAALGVAEVVEGIALRQAGFTVPVLVLAGIIPQTADAAVAHDLTPVITDTTVVDSLQAAAEKYTCTVPVHIKIDAGMGRQGTLPADLLDLAATIQAMDRLSLVGALAHFPMADDRASSSSQEVLETFAQAVKPLDGYCDGPCRIHLANSGGLFYVAGSHFDMVRPGISLYGYYPDGVAPTQPSDAGLLHPVMRFVTRVIQVRDVPQGAGLGYGHLFTAPRAMKLAVLPVGYEDGYLRILSNRAQVLISGKRVPVVGRISMNLTLVDVTDLPSVAVGDEAVLLGKQGDDEITADEIAKWMETISYEVLCLFGRMNDRAFMA